MTSKNTGGPAFASMAMGASAVHKQEGMSLRDYFAGQALAGISSDEGSIIHETHEEMATWCYKQADAMLAKRNMENNND